MNDPKENNLQDNAADTAANGAEQSAETVQAETVEPSPNQDDVVDVEPMDVAQLQAELEKAQQEIADKSDQLIRAQAEIANQRRRGEKQVEDAHKYASQKFIEAILPVMDSLEMGMQAEGDLDKIREGMQLTLKQFDSVMEKFHIEAVGQPGDVFNPEHHQAMSMQPHPDFDNNTVSMVMQKGYLLNGRVIRPAMVMVSKK